jgi:hypothetical protein
MAASAIYGLAFTLRQGPEHVVVIAYGPLGFVSSSVTRSAWLLVLCTLRSLLDTRTRPFNAYVTCSIRWVPDEQLCPQPQPQRRAAVNRRIGYAAQRPRCSSDWSLVRVRQTARQTSAPHQHIHWEQQWSAPGCHESRNRAAKHSGRHCSAAERLHRRQLAERKQAATLAQVRQQLELARRAGHAHQSPTVAGTHGCHIGGRTPQPSTASTRSQYVQRTGRGRA